MHSRQNNMCIYVLLGPQHYIDIKGKLHWMTIRTLKKNVYMHTCQLPLFNWECPNFDPPPPIFLKVDFIICPYLCKILCIVLYIGNSGMSVCFKKIPLIRPYFWGFCVGRYAFVPATIIALTINANVKRNPTLTLILILIRTLPRTQNPIITLTVTLCCWRYYGRSNCCQSKCWWPFDSVSVMFVLKIFSTQQMQEITLKTLGGLSMGTDWHRHRIVQVSQICGKP